MKIIDYIAESEDKLVGTGALNEEILQTETKLGLSFSEDYREMLKKYNFVYLEGHEFTGIKDIKRLDVCKVTENHRKLNDFIPQNLYVVEELGIDEIVVWQNSKGEVFKSIDCSKPVKIADSLYQYIAYC